MRVGDNCRAIRKQCAVASVGAVLCVLGLFAASSSTETAVANGDTRTLHLYHTHTGETIDATFRVDGHYDPAVLKQLNHFLRDWRNNDEINMDPRLFDTLWEVYRTAGANEPIQIYSAYRSPETNAMLRRRSRAVAEHSQHMLGKAMDTTIPGFPMHLVREIGMKLQRGGVGWYPSANFVHLDVGGVRSWPRMPYDQLASLFPDGKTVHVASNGQVLPGYEAARAEIAARGGTEIPPAQESQGFFAWLFGGGSTTGAAREDEEDRSTAVATAPQAAPAPQAPAQPQDAMAYAGREPATGDDARAAIDGREPQATQQQVQQVASVEAKPAGDEVAPMAASVAPMPPRRPTDLAAALEIPLPPIRPAALGRGSRVVVQFAEAPRRDDRIRDLIAASASLRTAELPAIITQGARGALPGKALAFADPSVHSTASIAANASATRARSMSVSSVGLRAALRGSHKHEGMQATQPVVTASVTPVGIAPQLTGLRKAAKLTTQRASL